MIGNSIVVVRGLFLIGLVLGPNALFGSSKILGSLSLQIHHREFLDSRLAENSNYQFGRFSAIEPELTASFLHWNGLEPFFGFSFIQQTSSRLPGLPDSNGFPSEDRFRFQFFGFSLGARYLPWTRAYSFFIPFIDAAFTARVGKFEKLSSDEDQSSKQTGGGLGIRGGGGFQFSLLSDPKLDSEMSSIWNLKDFGLIVSGSYTLPAFWKSGLGQVDPVKSWTAGLGMVFSW